MPFIFSEILIFWSLSHKINHLEFVDSHYQTSADGDEGGSKQTKKRKKPFKDKYPWKKEDETFFEVVTKETFYTLNKPHEDKKVFDSMSSPLSNSNDKGTEKKGKDEKVEAKPNETLEMKKTKSLTDLCGNKKMKGGSNEGNKSKGLAKKSPNKLCAGTTTHSDGGKRNKYTGSERNYSKIRETYNRDLNETNARYQNCLEDNECKCK